MIYILPISHDVQFGKNIALSEKFHEYLIKINKKLKINVICEEASEDDLNSPINTPIIKKVATENNIKYIPCDLGDEERIKAGIPSAEKLAEKIQLARFSFIRDTKKTVKFPQEKYNEFRREMGLYEEIREKHWLEIIKNLKDKNTLLVIGAGHISTFHSSRGEGIDSLFKKEKLNFQILSSDYISKKYLSKSVTLRA